MICTVNPAVLPTDPAYQMHAYYIENGSIDCSNHAGATGVTTKTTWSSSDTSVASIDAAGLISGYASTGLPKSTTISATYKDITETTTFTVAAAPVCVPNCSNESNVCQRTTFSDGCSGTCTGTKSCVSYRSWKEVAP